MGSFTLITKLVNQNSRASMLAFNGLFSNIAFAFYNMTAGYAYNSISKNIPFQIAFYFYAFASVVTFIAGVTGKIKMK